MSEAAGQLDGGEDQLPDARLAVVLEGAARGDQDAWRELAGLYGRRVYAMVRSRLRNDDMAEEITQSVFATIAVKMRDGSYSERGRFEAWLFRITMNRVRDEVRRRASRPGEAELDAGGELEDRVLAGGGGGGAALVGEAQSHRRELSLLRKAVAMLSEADREVVELRHQAGLSFGTMSQVLEEPLGTLLARHHRALKKLREHLAGLGMKTIGDDGDGPGAAQPAVGRVRGSATGRATDGESR
jgi:RNA polymerase sigma-70 factor (ECF subfamily)